MERIHRFLILTIADLSFRGRSAFADQQKVTEWGTQKVVKSRAVIKSGEYAVIPPEGRVTKVLPGFNGCDFTILASPKMGVSFVFYVATILLSGGTTSRSPMKLILSVSFM